MDASRAYGLGRQMAARGGEIKAPNFELLHARRMAEELERHFWQGVRDVRAEDRINQEE